MFNPDMFNPIIFKPNMFNPNMLNPDIFNPDMFNLGIELTVYKDWIVLQMGSHTQAT